MTALSIFYFCLLVHCGVLSGFMFQVFSFFGLVGSEVHCYHDIKGHTTYYLKLNVSNIMAASNTQGGTPDLK